MAFAAYNIGGNNYFKLRNLGRDFNVSRDDERSAIVVETSEAYNANT